MKDELLIRNIYLIQISDNQINPIFCDLKIENGKIQEIISKDFTEFINLDEQVSKNEFEYDAKGSVATIPMINFHEHIYSRLAKGLNVKGSTDNFHKILKNLWWKLDFVLDEDMVRASAMMAALESIQDGTTYIFDHHSSPNFSKGSLKTIADTLSSFNLRGTICFETTDRNGVELSQKGIEENFEFIQSSGNDFKGMLGLHAS
ncbi:MAG: hypothetical protein N3F03_00480, partial [Ignavibacteria bacterium]|nr:hypothetical protein [Ignavibacteria bacterium]